MKKINLINKKKQTKIHKGEGKVWYISKKQNGSCYYVKEVDTENQAINWTTQRCQALGFRTESGVHHFIHAYMNGRTDVYLIHTSKES